MTDVEFWSLAIMVAAFVLTGVWAAVSSRSLEKRSPSDFAGYRRGDSFTAGYILYGAIALCLVFGGGFWQTQKHSSAGAVMWAAGCLMIMAAVASATRRSRRCRNCGGRMEGYRDRLMPANGVRIFYVCHRCKKYEEGATYSVGAD